MDPNLKEREGPYAPRMEEIIGREYYIEKIREAISAKTNQSHAIYFVGEGGVGKTALLERVAEIQKDQNITPFLWTGIIDLYHADYHSPGGLRRAISDALDTENKYFQKSRRLYKEYQERRSQGLAGPELEKLRKGLDEQFRKDYAGLAETTRLVLSFDTVEVVEHETDIVVQVGRIKDIDSVIKHWILQQVTRLPNTVVLFAGRPRRALQMAFKMAFAKAQQDFQLLHVEPLNKHYASEYINYIARRRPELLPCLTAEVRKAILQIAAGRPIFLTLFAEVLLHSNNLGRLFSLDAKRSEGEIEALLAEHLWHNLSGPYQEMMHFLAHARKGLDAELLRYLAPRDWSDDDVQKNLECMQDLLFVKARPRTTQLFLHDAIYDLFDKYLQGEREGGEGYSSIAKFYRLQMEAGGSRGKQEELMLTRLYYEFQADAKTGYEEYYAPWDDDAIRSHEVGFDMRLRDEGLRFMERYTRVASPFYHPRIAGRVDRSAIDRDCAVRWVDRFLARSESKKAIRLAETFHTAKHPAFNWVTVRDPIYKADLLSTVAEGLLRVGRSGQAESLLDEAIDILKGAWESDGFRKRSRSRILGRAHYNRGYLYLMSGRYHLARPHFLTALHYFENAGLQDEVVSTHNSLAQMFALMGRVWRAERYIDKVQRGREELGRKYLVALTRNMRGLIHTLQDHPELGVSECSDALSACREMEDPRAIALASLGLGLALRKCGDHWKLGRCSKAKAEEYFYESERHLLEALEILQNQVSEPIYIWEANNEFGSLYCDWAWLTRHSEHGDGEKIYDRAKELYTRSIKYQKMALGIARDHGLEFQKADSCDDLAQVYGDQGFFYSETGNLRAARKDLARSLRYMKQIEGRIPRKYKLHRGKGFGVASDSDVAYWLQLGKLHLWRGRWLSRDLDARLVPGSSKKNQLRKAMRELILAAVYFERYWPPSSELEYSLAIFSDFLQNNDISVDFARTQVHRLALEYKIDLHVVELAIVDSLMD